MNSIEVTRSSKEVDQLVQDFEKNRARKDIPALSDALNQNKLDVAQGLIDRKANVNEYAKNPDGQLGMAPIHFAKSPEAVQMLAAAGAKIDAPYKSDQSPSALTGETKLQTLALTGQPKDMPMIDALLKAGADGNKKFGRDIIYGRDSDVPVADRITRDDMSMAAKLDVIRENTKPTIELQLLTKGKDDKGYTLVDETTDFQKMMGNANKLQQQGVNIIVAEKENHNVIHAKSNLYNDVDVGRVIEPKSSPSGTFLKGRGEVIPMNFYDKLGGVDVQKFETQQQAKAEQSRAEPAPESIKASASISKPVEAKAPGQSATSLADTGEAPNRPVTGAKGPEVTLGAPNEKNATAASYEAPKTSAAAGKDASDKPIVEPEKKAPQAATDVQPAAAVGGKQQDADAAVVDEKGRKVILTKSDYALPDSLVSSYNVKNGQFKDKSTDTVRFEDHGRKLSTPVEDRKVIADMIAVADAKNWGTLELKGTENFKQLAWLEASARGMETKGYKPTERDLEQLDVLKRERGVPAIAGASEKNANTLEVVVGRDRTSPEAAPESQAAKSAKATAAPEVVADKPSAAPKASSKTAAAPEAANEQSAAKSATAAAPAPGKAIDGASDSRDTGKLLEHGPAKFNFNPKENDNYYVKLGTPNGDKVIWGKDLERAIGESGVKTGDTINLSRNGKENVVVERNKLDGKGDVIGKEPIEAIKNKWEVKPVEITRAMSPSEQLKVEAAMKVLDKAISKYPEKDRAHIVSKFNDRINKGSMDLPTPKVSERSVQKPIPEQARDKGVKQEQVRSR